MLDLQIKDPSKDRYRALAISSVWELPRIRAANAVVIGAGALGNEVSKSLAMMGVRLLVILDKDTVEVANVTRSVFFRESDHGRAKTEVLRDRLRDLNPDVEVVTLTGDLNALLGLGLLRRMDMVFSCLDSRIARRSLNRMCQKVGKSWVDGAMENLIGTVAVFSAGSGPCYECTLTKTELTVIAEAVSCRGIALKNVALGKVPTTPTMGSIIGALQVQEGMKLLHGDVAKSLAGKRLVINSVDNDFYVTESSRKQNCEGHFRYGEVIEVAEFAAKKTSARAILDDFRKHYGADGVLDLGREIVIEIRCRTCDTREILGEPVRTMTQDRVRCSQCGGLRQLVTTHTVRGDEAYADWPLARLGIPQLDVLEVRGPTNRAWYELTGDMASFPLETGIGASNVP
jgi:molybdopterin/thiamine biosynthesis adenylyltransferase